MKKGDDATRSLKSLIAALPDDPDQIKFVKKLSVRDAIIGLQKPVGQKVFTKRQLKELIEAAHPELAPVAMANLEASLNRAKALIECVKTGEQNVYRFKGAKQ
jgi:L-fucose mutarotase/ribose pyranase (RbsD/FucU family)